MTDVTVTKLDPKAFYAAVEAIVESHNLEYIEAVCFYCEKHGIEIETAASMITSNPKIKSLIQEEGEQLNFLTKSARLPV
jgi:hypothetical protein